jgi:hypothetical protein
MEFVDILLMAQLVEQLSELIDIPGPSRANGHCSHRGQSKASLRGA